MAYAWRMSERRGLVFLLVLVVLAFYAAANPSGAFPLIAEGKGPPTQQHQPKPYESGYPNGDAARPFNVVARCDHGCGYAEDNKSWKEKVLTDPIATFTALLFVVSFWQGILILRAERLAQRSTKAAFLAARNTLRATRPRITFQTFWMNSSFEGAVPTIPIERGQYWQSIGGEAVNNGTAIGFVKQGELASSVGQIGEPIAADTTPSSIYGDVPIGAREQYSPPLAVHTMLLSDAFDRGDAGPAFIWGWLRYSDIHGVIRRAGFAFEYTKPITSVEDGTFNPCGPESYWYDVEEYDPQSDASP
jgi:hypothetical protein